MRRIDTSFLLLATACLIVGVSMGIGMGIAHDFQFAPVHAHLNLLGWASLALFGLVYKAYPQLAHSRLALAHFAASATSAVVFPFGIYFSIAHQTPGVAIGASLVWLLGAVLFLANLVRAFVIAPARIRSPLEQAPA
jgi:cbb3-type cytochrome oxidase subunit 1